MPKIYTNGIEQEMTTEQVAEFAETQKLAKEHRIKVHEQKQKAIDDKKSGRQKLKDLGLTDDEINNLFAVEK